MTLRITLTPDAAWYTTRAALLRVAASKPARMAASAQRANVVMLAALQAEAPVSPDHIGDGPRLKDSFGSNIALGDPTVIRFTNTRPYYKFVETGHGDIYPVNAKALRFVVNGGVVFAKHVSPVDPNPVRLRASKRAVPDLVGVVIQHALMIRDALVRGG